MAKTDSDTETLHATIIVPETGEPPPPAATRHGAVSVGAAALGAFISGRYKPQHGERVGVLLCGGNVDPTKI